MLIAFLVAYYKERKKNIETIVNALQNGTVKPDKIYLLNNNSELEFDLEGVSIINSSENLGHRARFTTALSIPSDYYFFIDDDMCVKEKTLENFMKYADEDCCLTLAGKVLLENGKYAQSKLIWGSQIDESISIDITVGVGSMFCSFNSLVNMLKLERELRKYPEYENGREADIILGMANKPLLVSANKDSDLKSLSSGGVGMCKEENHVL
jgi:hypothetical protein